MLFSLKTWIGKRHVLCSELIVLEFVGFCIKGNKGGVGLLGLGQRH